MRSVYGGWYGVSPGLPIQIAPKKKQRKEPGQQGFLGTRRLLVRFFLDNFRIFSSGIDQMHIIIANRNPK
jgi:hypothetical protein